MSVFHSSKSFSSLVLGAVCSSVASMRRRFGGRRGASAVRCDGHRGDGTSAAATAASARPRRMFARCWQCNSRPGLAAATLGGRGARRKTPAPKRVLPASNETLPRAIIKAARWTNGAAVQCTSATASASGFRAVRLPDCSPVGVLRGVLRAIAAKITARTCRRRVRQLSTVR